MTIEGNDLIVLMLSWDPEWEVWDPLMMSTCDSCAMIHYKLNNKYYIFADCCGTEYKKTV